MVTYGIWHGKDATVAVLERYAIAFLRVRKDNIISIFQHREYGVLGVVYGFGENRDARAVCSSKEPGKKEVYFSHEEGADYIKQHSRDSYRITEQNGLIYTMYDGTEFSLTLAEEIDMAMFDRTYPVNQTMPVARRMALWNINKYASCQQGNFNAGIDTEKYSIIYMFSTDNKTVYCRVGVNGYSEKGRAMRSTICIRHNECRMLEDNLEALKEYVPMEECFVEDGCAFPPDGGWYWSIKEVTADRILLNGCGGDTYVINRK